MQYHEAKDFRSTLNKLWHTGGQYQKAADEVWGLLGRMSDVDAKAEHIFRGLNTTNHGESRIKHCVKYDLNAYCRLITVQTNGYCIFLFIGKHDDCDKWLNRNRGLEPVVGENQRVVVTFQSMGDDPAERVDTQLGRYSGPLFERIDESLFDQLFENLPRRLTRQLEKITATIRVDELWAIVSEIEDAEQRQAVHDVFAMLRDDRVVQAVARIKLHARELQPLDTVPESQLPDLVDSDVIRRIDPSSPQYSEALRRFMLTARYRDWMTFMHPDQEAIANEDFDGPAKLVGVSGSGKTCVVVQRAVRLAALYPSERILVVTLNKALAALIDDLITACAPSDDRGRIDVRPFAVLCKELMLNFEPHKTHEYDDVTWKSNEHVDQIWQQFYRCKNNNFDARVLSDVNDSLLARGWNAQRYVREEIDWLRSALRPEERKKYLEIVRKGRTVPLLGPSREKVLLGATGWDDMMDVIGVKDAMGIAQSVSRYRSRISPRYRCVLIDEVQDFGNVELEIIRALVLPAPNDVFLCGDAAQAVTSKHQSLREVGMAPPPARSRFLSKNYRNSRDVLLLAHEVLYRNMTPELMDREDLKVLDPEYSTYSAATPLLLRADSLEMELRGAFATCRSVLEERPDAKACIAICGYSQFELGSFGKRLQLPLLDGATSIDDGQLFLSDLDQTKGFEFDIVCILNCSEGVIPDVTAPAEDHYRELARLYVAMTRAKSQLVVSFSGQPSPFFAEVSESILGADWSEYEDLQTAPPVGTPRRLAVSQSPAKGKKWREMSGQEFLSTEAAIGVSLELSAKMRTLVDGVGLLRQGQNLKWRTLGSAADALARTPRMRNLWGPDVSRQFDELVAQLG